MKTLSDKEIVQTVRNLMTDQRLYKDPELSLIILASKIQVSRNKLSRAINLVTGKNFSSYVNDFRIKESLRVLSSKQHSPRFIQGFYKEVGFASKSTFYKTFKEATGISPADYKKQKKAKKK